MINFSRRDRPADANDTVKGTLTTAAYSGAAPTSTNTGVTGVTPATPAGVARTPRMMTPVRETMPASAAAIPRDVPPPAAPPAPGRPADVAVPVSETVVPEGSKLFIGVNILLKGVEISNCDALVIEGNVEATVHSKAMEISKPGTLKGTALIDVAEIHGDFSGELTARSRLVVHGTGRVQGTIRYGKLIVAEGGELSGDVKCLDDAAQRPKPLVGTVVEPARPASQAAH